MVRCYEPGFTIVKPSGRALAVVMEHWPPSLSSSVPDQIGGKLQRMIQYPPAGRCGTWLPDRGFGGYWIARIKRAVTVGVRERAWLTFRV